jgi:hypothetical protein
VCANPATFRAFGFASLTAFWLVFKSLVGEKHLFAGGKNELRITIGTLQYPVVVFHEPLSPGPFNAERQARSILVYSRSKWKSSPLGTPGAFHKGLRAQAKQLPVIP